MKPTISWYSVFLASLAGLVVPSGTSALADDIYACDGHETCLHGRLELSEYSCSIEDAAAFDAATGRDLRHFPPDRIVDFLHMKLQMRFETLNDRKFTAVQTLSFTPVGTATTGLSLDAVDLKIISVKLDGRDVEHAYDGKKLSMRFDPPLAEAGGNSGGSRELMIEYECVQPYAGMIFTPSSPEAPNYAAEVHTQGQPETNRHWFVCHDFPNERMTTELIVDVPAEFSVSSNGRLVSNLVNGQRAVWHWSQDKPHVAYLVSLVIGKFDIVEIPHARVPMKVWVPQGLGVHVQQTYGRTGEMIDLFEKRFGVAYPWDRYDQLTVKNFRAGGMENTSATSMYPTAILDETALLDADLDGLIAHELAHQWTGDLITCKSWAHIWLNEGWATYGSALWNEQRYGQEGYLDSIRGSFNVAERDKTINDLPMVSPVYGEPFETFRRPANPYPKGSSILHMLRMMLGEEVFWKGVHLYMNRHAMGVVETNDFRYALEEVSGLGLEWFFEQWCYRPGTPELKVAVNYDAASRALKIDLEQTQKIDERTPAFRFNLPVYVKTSAGERTFVIEVREKVASYQTNLDGPPSIVAIDPNLHVLKTIIVDKPMELWIEQAKAGPTIAARHEAVEALGQIDSVESIALLGEMVRDDNVRYTLRRTAVDALADLASNEAKAALLTLAKENLPEARVRVTIVEKLKKLKKEDVVELLAQLAGSDPSYAVRVAAIEGLVHHKASEQAELITELVAFNSQHDQVRNAALRALGELDQSRGLELAIQYAAYGHMDRSRPVAIEVIGKLAKHDPNRAVTFLIGLLNDVENRSVVAAGEALAEVGDQRAIDSVKAIADSHRNPRLREDAASWLAKLQKKTEG